MTTNVAPPFVHHCSQDGPIGEIKMLTASTQQSVNALVEMQKSLQSDMKALAERITTSLVDAREHAIKIESLRGDVGRLYDRMREFENEKIPNLMHQLEQVVVTLKKYEDVKVIDRVDNLESYKDKVSGGIKLAMAFPVLTGILTVIVTSVH